MAGLAIQGALGGGATFGNDPRRRSVRPQMLLELFP